MSQTGKSGETIGNFLNYDQYFSIERPKTYDLCTCLIIIMPVNSLYSIDCIGSVCVDIDKVSTSVTYKSFTLVCQCIIFHPTIKEENITLDCLPQYYNFHFWLHSWEFLDFFLDLLTCVSVSNLTFKTSAMVAYVMI